MLKGQFKNSYKKAGVNGVKTVFVYRVSGTKEEVEQYRTLREDEGYLVEDTDGTPLFFQSVYYGDNIQLTITTNDNVIVDTSEFDKVQSIVDTNPFLKDEMARRFSDKIINNMRGSSQGSQVKNETPTDLNNG
jgi:hypothetical protein